MKGTYIHVWDVSPGKFMKDIYNIDSVKQNNECQCQQVIDKDYFPSELDVMPRGLLHVCFVWPYEA